MHDYPSPNLRDEPAWRGTIPPGAGEGSPPSRTGPAASASAGRPHWPPGSPGSRSLYEKQTQILAIFWLVGWYLYDTKLQVSKYGSLSSVRYVSCRKFFQWCGSRIIAPELDQSSDLDLTFLHKKISNLFTQENLLNCWKFVKWLNPSMITVHTYFFRKSLKYFKSLEAVPL
jgi:hypothetical protein